jgi:hypothetical protein
MRLEASRLSVCEPKMNQWQTVRSRVQPCAAARRNGVQPERRALPCVTVQTAQNRARGRAVSGIGVSVHAEDLDVNEQNRAVPV